MTFKDKPQVTGIDCVVKAEQSPLVQGIYPEVAQNYSRFSFPATMCQEDMDLCLLFSISVPSAPGAVPGT